VQAERVPSRGTGCRERSDRSWAEGTPKRAEGGALSRLQRMEKLSAGVTSGRASDGGESPVRKRTGKPLRGLRTLPRARGVNPLEKALRKRAAVCGFSRARRELDSSQFAERREWRSAVGQRRRRQSGARSGAPAGAAKLRDRERSPLSSASLRATDRNPDGPKPRAGSGRSLEPGRNATRQIPFNIADDLMAFP